VGLFHLPVQGHYSLIVSQHESPAEITEMMRKTKSGGLRSRRQILVATGQIRRGRIHHADQDARVRLRKQDRTRKSRPYLMQGDNHGLKPLETH
jgi:hypothetical protein